MSGHYRVTLQQWASEHLSDASTNQRAAMLSPDQWEARSPPYIPELKHKNTVGSQWDYLSCDLLSPCSPLMTPACPLVSPDTASTSLYHSASSLTSLTSARPRKCGQFWSQGVSLWCEQTSRGARNVQTLGCHQEPGRQSAQRNESWFDPPGAATISAGPNYQIRAKSWAELPRRFDKMQLPSGLRSLLPASAVENDRFWTRNAGLELFTQTSDTSTRAGAN